MLDVVQVDPLGPLVATGLDYLKAGRLGGARHLARALAAADRVLGGRDWNTPLGLMLAGRAVNAGSHEHGPRDCPLLARI